MAMLYLNRKTISIACCSLFLLSVVAMGLTINIGGQQGDQRLRDSSRGEMTDLVKEIEASSDQSLTVAGNSDCPLRISEARVKEVTAASFTKLTGKLTNLETVCSVPEVTLVNTSGQTITTFYLAIRDPKSRITVGFIKSDIAIKPGESYTVTHKNFTGSKRMTIGGKDGQIREVSVEPGFDSEKRWIDFAPRSDLFVTVAKVDFENGESWIIKEGGDVR